MLFLIAIFVVGLAIFVLNFMPEYFLFRHRSERYYADFATACDVVLEQHPLGTNKFIELHAMDSSIPKIIRDLRPAKIKLAPNWVWILHGEGIEFGITWEQQNQTQTNAWTLSATCESDIKIVYVR